MEYGGDKDEGTGKRVRVKRRGAGFKVMRLQEMRRVRVRMDNLGSEVRVKG